MGLRDGQLWESADCAMVIIIPAFGYDPGGKSIGYEIYRKRADGSYQPFKGLSYKRKLMLGSQKRIQQKR
jgi:hypothetical protein